MLALRSLLDFTFPDHQIDQDRDEADWNEGQYHDHPHRGVLRSQVLFGAVLEVERVDVDEEVLSAGVRVEAPQVGRHHLHTDGQAAVGSETDNNKKIRTNQTINNSCINSQAVVLADALQVAPLVRSQLHHLQVEFCFTKLLAVVQQLLPCTWFVR